LGEIGLPVAAAKDFTGDDRTANDVQRGVRLTNPSAMCRSHRQVSLFETIQVSSSIAQIAGRAIAFDQKEASRVP
jgi:hypothetical protein